eukprot:COSAG02_NODE_816_length_16859_cov_15.645764_7_plen_152_part_00
MCGLARLHLSRAQYAMGSTSLTKDISTYVKREYDLAYPSDGASLLVPKRTRARAVSQPRCVGEPSQPFPSSCWLPLKGAVQPLLAVLALTVRVPGSSATGKATTGVFHCVCGRSFAAACTYETHYSMWFNVQCPDAVISVLLWRSKDNPYD